MTTVLYLALAAGAAMLAATVAFTLKKRSRDYKALYIRETWMTAVLGAMMIALGFFFPAAKLMDATLVGTDANSYWFVIGFSLLCHIMGDFTVLFALVKCIALYEDRVVEHSFLGQETTIYWKDVVKVDKPMMRSCYVLKDRQGNSISAGGDNKALKTFAEFARPKVKSAGSGNLLAQVEHRLRGKH